MAGKAFSRLGVALFPCALASALMAAPSAARAQNYLPLQVGNQWVYAGLLGGSETLTVTGIVWIRGREAFVIRYGPSAHNQGLENYWSTAPDGSVLLHGFNRTLEAFGYIYDPPITFLEAPPALGNTWNQIVTAYALPDTIATETLSITFKVFEAATLTVPAGAFFAYGVGQSPLGTTGAAPAGMFSMSGVRITSTSQATDWFADGIGNVKYVSDQEYLLQAFGGPTATDAISWGGLKALYRR